MMTYDEFKTTIRRLIMYKENATCPCERADYISEIIWLKQEYTEYWNKLKLEGRDDIKWVDNFEFCELKLD